MSFLNNIFRRLKRAVVYGLIIVTIGSLIYTIVKFGGFGKKTSFSAIIDADTGNGIDDIFVLARVLSDPGFKLIGLTSAQWNYYPGKNTGSVEISQTMNDTILRLFRETGIPHPPGNNEMLRLWNDPAPQSSDAVEFIIKKAHESTKNNKLNIITLGSLTNLASAILKDSTIVPKLKVYSLGLYFEPVTKTWNKNEFNVRNDLDALDLLLNSDGLEMYIMPVSIANTLTFSTKEVLDELNYKGSEWDFLLSEWQKSVSGRKEISLPGIALIEAFLDSEFVKVEQISTPPENRRRRIYAYTRINPKLMNIDFWKTINTKIREDKKKAR